MKPFDGSGLMPPTLDVRLQIGSETTPVLGRGAIGLCGLMPEQDLRVGDVVPVERDGVNDFDTLSHAVVTGVDDIRFPNRIVELLNSSQIREVDRIASVVLRADIFGTDANGVLVYVQKTHSHAATHFADTPNLESLALEALGQAELSGQYCQINVDLGRVVGETELVTTSETDEIFYAKRPARDTYMRFVKGRSRVPTRHITLHTNKVARDPLLYELFSTWMGKVTPAFPGTPYEGPESKRFWSNHALVAGRQMLIDNTVTSTCPW
ncbi:MAG TPA: hypothetical protein VK674_03260 [Candidatus Limnocylindria bacterium]|nr:hypothetical protein [Candidatus Limnocylindria bacterium]